MVGRRVLLCRTCLSRLIREREVCRSEMANFRRSIGAYCALGPLLLGSRDGDLHAVALLIKERQGHGYVRGSTSQGRCQPGQRRRRRRCSQEPARGKVYADVRISAVDTGPSIALDHIMTLNLRILAALSFAMVAGCGGGHTSLDVDGGNGGTGSSTGVTAGRCGSIDASTGGDQSDTLTLDVSNDPRCPLAFSDISPAGQPCVVNGLICTYPEGQAECGPDGQTFTWYVDGATRGCSEWAPKVGTGCAVPGLICDYITGQPPLLSDFLTSYCCDGTRCAWAVEQGDNCPNGNTCGTIKASDYDQSCTLDSDCVIEPEGDFCVNECTNCASAVISRKAKAQYEVDLASKISMLLSCPCPLAPIPVCNHGKCADAPRPQ